ncbi:hypothetical protein IAQ61_008876 [Plenodomus lingam]|uniref:uncharacterized protein n=1 Tax=Leptosphaeria maculans TaxID=5022 RepID=UPI0033207D10|nr:hypothetical protein IAQ61_008876 [Plenodomus lingam]
MSRTPFHLPSLQTPPPPSTIHHPPSTIHHPPSTIHHPSSIIHHPPSSPIIITHHHHPSLQSPCPLPGKSPPRVPSKPTRAERSLTLPPPARSPGYKHVRLVARIFWTLAFWGRLTASANSSASFSTLVSPFPSLHTLDSFWERRPWVPDTALPETDPIIVHVDVTAITPMNPTNPMLFLHRTMAIAPTSSCPPSRYLPARPYHVLRFFSPEGNDM